MIRYSIKDLENYTQIKAHTLRIWEQRYNLLNPQRTENNIRFYSENDLKKILNVHLLYSNGLKISKIAKLEDEEIIDRVKQIIQEEVIEESSTINDFVLAISEMDADKMRSLLEESCNKFGFEKMYSVVVVPVLIKIGKLWQVNTFNIGHEHIFSNILRDFFILKTDQLVPETNVEKKIALFLPEHEEHELSLLYYHYLLRSAGCECYYFGATLPLADLKKSVEQVQPDFLVTNLIAKVSDQRIESLFKELGTFFDLNRIKVGGAQAHANKALIPKEVQLFKTSEGLFNQIVDRIIRTKK